jgi:hypothetical protein
LLKGFVMRTKFRVGVVGSLLALGLLAAGCQSMGGGSSPSKSAVLITNHGHSEIFTAGQGGQIIAYTDGKAEHCAQCEADVKAYYLTGQIDPVCKMCGATRTVIPYDASVGHQ